MDKKRLITRMLAFSAILFIIFTIVNFGFQSNEPIEISYTELERMIKSGEVLSVRFYPDRIEGTVKINGFKQAYFTTKIFAEDREHFKELARRQSPPTLIVNEATSESSAWSTAASVLSVILFISLIILVFNLMIRNGKGGAGSMLNFGSISKKKYIKPNVSFKDVAGIDEAKEELEEIVQFLKNPRKFTRLGARIPKGVLAVGDPGVGKTLLAKAVAGEANVPFIYASGTDFIEMFVGVGASRIRDLFRTARQQAPCIMFIDEIDAVGGKRQTNSQSGQEHNQTIDQLFVEMDGFEENMGIIVIGATNRVDSLDQALLRPGRFDRIVHVNKPDIFGREAILKIHARRIVLDQDVDLRDVARATTGFTGADLANIVNEAALKAARDNKLAVSNQDFDFAKEKVCFGTENRSLSRAISEEEKRITAYHEAGHALVAAILPEADPLYKVTIIPRRNALGFTSQIPEKDKYNVSENFLKELLAIFYGGRIAEEIVFGRITAGAQNDIERATALAISMVCEYGMFGEIKLKCRNYLTKRSMTHEYVPSPDTQREIDLAIGNLLQEAYNKAGGIIRENEQYLHAIALSLIEKETLTRDEIEQIIRKT